MPSVGHRKDSHRHGGHKTSRGRWSRSIEHLRTEARKSIWFAFQTLIGTNNDTVQIHTLKVLTASIGNALGIEKSEELHNQTEKTELDFQSYFKILETLMFEPLSKASNETMDLSSVDYQHVHNVCWVLFYNHEKGKTIPEGVDENVAYKMWMMFNLFCEEEDETSVPLFPIQLDPEEALIMFDAILSETGSMTGLTKSSEELGTEPVPYHKFLTTFFLHIYQNSKESVVKSAVGTVFEQFVEDLLKKGNMAKRGHQVKNWKDRFMVLNPTELKYYVSSNQKQMKGTIVFEKSHSVEVLPDKGGKRNMFVLHTQQKPYEMSATDVKTRNEWVSGIQVALEHCDDPHYHHHKTLARERMKKRNEVRREREEEDRKKREDEENQRRKEEEHLQKEHMNEEMLQQKMKELEDEKKRREELEALLKEQAAERELERQRLAELEAIKAELERLLELERQAKRDEETVRKLQAKLLEEESTKREELERLKKEQEELLNQEREMRVGLEGQRVEKEKCLSEAQQKLLQLETERHEASEKLQEAAERLQEAIKERNKMEEKVKLWKKPNVGLAQPATQPKFVFRTTHRGKGAFCEADFLKKARKQDEERGLSKKELDEKYGEIIPENDEEQNTNASDESTAVKEPHVNNTESIDIAEETETDKADEHVGESSRLIDGKDKLSDQGQNGTNGLNQEQTLDNSGEMGGIQTENEGQDEESEKSQPMNSSQQESLEEINKGNEMKDSSDKQFNSQADDQECHSPELLANESSEFKEGNSNMGTSGLKDDEALVSYEKENSEDPSDELDTENQDSSEQSVSNQGQNYENVEFQKNSDDKDTLSDSISASQTLDGGENETKFQNSDDEDHKERISSRESDNNEDKTRQVLKNANEDSDKTETLAQGKEYESSEINCENDKHDVYVNVSYEKNNDKTVENENESQRSSNNNGSDIAVDKSECRGFNNELYSTNKESTSENWDKREEKTEDRESNLYEEVDMRHNSS